MSSTRPAYTGPTFPTFEPTVYDFGAISVDVLTVEEIETGEYLYLDYDLPVATRRQFVDVTTQRPIAGATGRATYPLTGENIYRVTGTTLRRIRSSRSGRLVTRQVLSLESRTGETYSVAVIPSATVYTARPGF